MSFLTKNMDRTWSILFFISIFGLTFGGTSIQLDSGWVIKTGDNPEWANAAYDASDWTPVNVGLPWENAGLPGYDGFARYRLEFIFPQVWQTEEKHGFLSLSLGQIDDADVTYFNGEKIGATGSFPPDYKTGYYTPRTYRLPTTLVRWGEINVLAIQVYDGGNEGGLTKGPYTLGLPGVQDFIDITFELEDDDGIYFSPDPLPATIRIQNHSTMAFTLNAVFELTNDQIDSTRVVHSVGDTFILNAQDHVVKSLTFAPPEPGFYYVTCTLNDSYTKSMLLGYDPEKIITPLTRQADFEQFWQNRKKELAAVDPNFKITKTDRSNDKLDVYLVDMQSYGNVTIRGWYTVPTTAGPHPALLSLPGYTSTMWPYMQRTNVATLALNPRGHGNSTDDIDPQGDEFMFLGFDPAHPENYIYAGVYMDCLRAIDFLVSRPEIDATRIGAEGGSQGGGLSFATAALDSRVLFSAPDIPWLGDWVGYFQTEYWGRENYPKLFEKFPNLTFDDINRFLSYFDTMNMAEWITCPVLMSVGLQDKVCPPRTSFAPFNAVTSPKEYRVYPFAGHGTWQEHTNFKNAWMAKKLGIDNLGEN